LLVLATAGCGGDDEPSTSTTRALPDLSVPTTGTTPSDTQPSTPPATTTTVDPATETLPEEGPGSTPATPPADTPENDAPPPEDSPAQRCEDYCNENPGACG
jgi:hypothetical protein